MKTIIISIVCLLLGFGAAYVILSPSGEASAAKTEDVKQLYTCGMHPQIISDKPGYCPICEMKLTPKKEGAEKSGSILVDPATTQNMNLVTTNARYDKITKQVRAFGKVTFSEPNIYNVNLKISGWVENLLVDREGEKVYRGQPLVKIYSPELVAAQKELLIAQKGGNSDNMQSFYKSARERLSNWDISDRQITHLLESGEIVRTLTITSPVNGVVVRKTVTDGDHLMPGSELYRIADLSKVWVTASIYEQDLPYVKEGQIADLEFPNLPGTKISAPIDYVSPFLDSKNQVEIRMEVANPDLNLRPDMYSEVTINSELSGQRLVIPRSAVINSGAREIVYIASAEGGYLPRRVTTGTVGLDDMVELVRGVQADDAVVISGQFLLDSESRLSEAVGSGIHQHNHDALAQMDEDMKMDDGAKMDGDMKMDPPKNDSMRPNHGADRIKASTEVSGIYTCPMAEHYHVLQFGPGKCPECGMKLVPIEKTDNKNVFVCPMPEDSVVSDSAGRCPKCNMKLVPLFEKPAEMQDSLTEMKHKHSMQMDSSSSTMQHDNTMQIHGDKMDSSMFATHDVYTCPMPSHFHVLQYGEGQCSECGMKLVPVTETKNSEVYVCPMRQCGIVQNKPGECPVCSMNLVKLEAGHSDD